VNRILSPARLPVPPFRLEEYRAVTRHIEYISRELTPSVLPALTPSVLSELTQ
jgi:hypothetical protein